MPKQRGADAAVLKLRQQHQLAQVDEAWTVLDAYMPSRSVAFNNLMRSRVPTVPKICVLGNYAPGTELGFNDVAIGLVVHVAPKFGVKC